MSAKHHDTTNSDEANKRGVPSAFAFNTQTATPERSSRNRQLDAKLGQEPNVDDDLLKIKGVTIEVEQALKKVGINTYEKLGGL